MSDAQKTPPADPAADDEAAAAARRAAFTAEVQARTGIDEDMIRTLVHTFYDRIRRDEMLAPIFEARIKDWPWHLDRMCRFWSSVALMTGVYSGRPMPAHAPLPVDARHFDRWLELFEATAREVCPPAAADHFLERAHRIAESLEMGVAVFRGVMLRRGERLGPVDPLAT
jgi:hemoglobin